jgi:hypothetical protein
VSSVIAGPTVPHVHEGVRVPPGASRRWLASLAVVADAIQQHRKRAFDRGPKARPIADRSADGPERPLRPLLDGVAASHNGKDQRTLATHPFGDGSLLVLALCDTLRWMDTERCQCVKCGYPLQAPTSACPVCQPGGGVPEHVKEQWAISHARDNVLFLAGDGAVVPESALWEQAGLLEEDVRPLLSRMEEDGEIDRFAGFYRLRSAAEASSD